MIILFWVVVGILIIYWLIFEIDWIGSKNKKEDNNKVDDEILKNIETESFVVKEKRGELPPDNPWSF